MNEKMILKDFRYRLLRKYVEHALNVCNSYYHKINDYDDIYMQLEMCTLYKKWKRRYELYTLCKQQKYNQLKAIQGDALIKYLDNRIKFIKNNQKTIM